MRSCGISLLSLKSLALSVSLSICMQLYRLYTYRNTVQHCATNHHLWHRFEFWCATYYWKHAAWTWRPPRPKDSRYLGPSNEQALPPIARPWRRHGWRGQLWGGLTLDSCDLVIDFPIAMKPEPCTQDRQWLATVQEWVRAAWLCLNNWANPWLLPEKTILRVLITRFLLAFRNPPPQRGKSTLSIQFFPRLSY